MEEAYYFDISALTFEDLFQCLFASPEPEEVPFRLDPNGKEIFLVEIARPEVVVRHLTRLFTDFSQLVRGVSAESLERGIDQAIGLSGFELVTVLWDNTLSLEPRLACVRSMYRVFADFVAKCDGEVVERCFFMWWDYVCWGFWSDRTRERKVAKEEYELLSEEDRRLVDAMFETLVEILKLDGDGPKRCALHGLGHLHHPGVASVVQKFIDSLPLDLPAAERKWLEDCRDGKVM